MQDEKVFSNTFKKLFGCINYVKFPFNSINSEEGRQNQKQTTTKNKNTPPPKKRGPSSHNRL